MVTKTKSTSSSSASPWLDLSAGTLVRTIWQGRRQLLVTVLLFAGLGVPVALLTPSEFVSEARIMPEMGGAGGDLLKRLASVAGFSGMDMADSEGLDAIRPDLYPNVLQSTPFILYLIDQPVMTTGGQQTAVGHLLKPGTAGDWSFKKLFASDKRSQPTLPAKPGRPLQLSDRQQELAEDIGERINARLDTRSGVISIAARMPDARVAATVAQLAMDYLTQYVTNYRTEKARLDLHFYSNRLTEARRRYQTAQLDVFQYNDRHKYRVVVMQAATMDKQRMEAELSIAQTVYAELSRQFEQAKLRVQERTPVFKVLEPPQVPHKRVSPKRTMMVLFFTLAGLTVGVVYRLARQADWAGRLRAILEESPDKSVGR